MRRERHPGGLSPALDRAFPGFCSFTAFFFPGALAAGAGSAFFYGRLLRTGRVGEVD